MKRVLFPVLLFILIPFIANAQSDVNKMLKDISGKVDEIIIKSDGKVYTFNGDEAEKLFSAMKQDKKMKHFEFFTDGGKIIKGDSLNKKIVIKKLKDDDNDTDEDIMVYINDEDTDSIGEDVKQIEKKIIVSSDDGKKVVKVTTNENGKENIEVYEGKAAEEYLDKMKDEKEIDAKVDVDKDSKGKKIKKIIIEKEEKTK